MTVKREIIPSDFDFWGAAVSTINRVREENKEEEFNFLIEETFPEVVDATALNDFVAFDDDFIFEALGIASEE